MCLRRTRQAAGRRRRRRSGELGAARRATTSDGAAKAHASRRRRQSVRQAAVSPIRLACKQRRGHGCETNDERRTSRGARGRASECSRERERASWRAEPHTTRVNRATSGGDQRARVVRGLRTQQAVVATTHTRTHGHRTRAHDTETQQQQQRRRRSEGGRERRQRKAAEGVYEVAPTLGLLYSARVPDHLAPPAARANREAVSWP